METSSDPYISLARRMDKFPTGITHTPEMMAVLREVFLPEEARIAVAMPGRGAPASEMAEAMGQPVEVIEQLLERMADRGLVVPFDHRGSRVYTLLGLGPGVMDLRLMSGARTSEQSRIARLFEAYYQSGGLEELHKGPAWTRVLSIERDVPSHVEVFPYERVSDIVHSLSSYALTNCYCREEATLAGNGCGAPADVCMQFGPFADYLVERGFALRATQDDMFRALDRSEEAALVHLTNNSQSGFSFICNCCGCCCGILRGINQLNRLDTIAKSRLQAQIRAEDCVGCAVCLDRCQVEALTMTDDLALVDVERCIGCGLCVESCHTSSIELRPREVHVEPYPSRRELEKARMQWRGLM